MRDSLSILDQAISMGNGNVDYNTVVSMLGLVTNEHLFNLTNAVIQRSVEKSIGMSIEPLPNSSLCLENRRASL